jgi:hypothetical protein
VTRSHPQTVLNQDPSEGVGFEPTVRFPVRLISSQDDERGRVASPRQRGAQTDPKKHVKTTFSVTKCDPKRMVQERRESLVLSPIK